MKLLTKTGILILIVGFAFLAGTFYRGTSEVRFSRSCGLKPESWSRKGNMLDSNVMYSSYFLAPRDYSLEVKINETINVYVMDSKGMNLWITKGELEPVFFHEKVAQETLKFHLSNRGDYVFLCYNPSENSAEGLLIISGYGIEDDLLCGSLTIIVIGTVITIVSFIPRSSNKKPNTLKKTGVLSVALLVFLMLSLPVASCAAQSSILAPTWMKEGTYAYYTFQAGSSAMYGNITHVNFVNGSNIMYTNVTSIVFRWDCVQLDDNMAMLNVSYKITTEPGTEDLYISTLLKVNTVTRSVYLQNGTQIGTTLLWLPSTPAKGQEIVLWDLPPDKVTAKIVTEYEFNGEPITYADTTQGAQRAFQYTDPVGIMNGVNITNNSQYSWSPYYEYDTGLMVWGTLKNETIVIALGLQQYTMPERMFTNVSMLPPKVIIDWSYVLGLAGIGVSIILIVAILIVKKYRQRK